MKVKSYQKAPLQQEMRNGILLSVAILFVLSLYLVKTPISGLETILTIFALVAFIVPLVLMFFKTVRAVIRKDAEANPNFRWLVAALYLILSLSFGFFTEQIQPVHFLNWAIFVFLPTAVYTFFPTQSVKLHVIDLLVALLLWLPVELHVLPLIQVPTSMVMFDMAKMTAVMLGLYYFIAIRNIDFGLTFKLSMSEGTRIVLNFFIAFLIAIIVGRIAGFVSLQKHLPEFSLILAQFFVIALFVALPEELLFRGVIFKILADKFKGVRYSVLYAILLSAFIFALAHANSTVGPFAVIQLGSFSWQCPWGTMLLTFITGFFYAWIYIRTQKLSAAILLHVLLQWIWLVCF